MKNPMFQWRRFAGFAVLCTLLISAAITTPSCRTIDTATTPDQVVTTVTLRLGTLKTLQTQMAAGPVADPVLVQVLSDDIAAWLYLQSALDRWETQKDLKQTILSEKVAEAAAIKKIGAGQYTPQQKTDLIAALVKSWSNLNTYYHPTATPPPAPATTSAK